MAVRLSTEMKNAEMLWAQGVLHDATVSLYEGAQPQSADTEPSTHPLATIVGLEFCRPKNGMIGIKMPRSATPFSNGTPGWFRLSSTNFPGVSLDGSIPDNMVLHDPCLKKGTNLVIHTFNLYAGKEGTPHIEPARAGKGQTSLWIAWVILVILWVIGFVKKDVKK
jgi:hypothetical protein